MKRVALSGLMVLAVLATRAVFADAVVVRGTVTNQADAPVDGAQVRVGNLFTVLESATGADGTYEVTFGSVLNSNFSFSAKATDYRDFSQAFTPYELDLDDGVKDTITKDIQLQSLIADTLVVMGKITNRSGVSLMGAVVTSSFNLGTVVLTDSTDAQGQYLFKAPNVIEATRAAISATADGYRNAGPVTGEHSGATDDGVNDTIVVDLTLESIDDIVVLGTVLDGNGTPVEDADVSLCIKVIGSCLDVPAVSTNGAGEFKFNPIPNTLPIDPVPTTVTVSKEDMIAIDSATLDIDPGDGVADTLSFTITLSDEDVYIQDTISIGAFGHEGTDTSLMTASVSLKIQAGDSLLLERNVELTELELGNPRILTPAIQVPEGTDSLTFIASAVFAWGDTLHDTIKTDIEKQKITFAFLVDLSTGAGPTNPPVLFREPSQSVSVMVYTLSGRRIGVFEANTKSLIRDLAPRLSSHGTQVYLLRWRVGDTVKSKRIGIRGR